MEDGQIRVTFSEKEKKRSRLCYDGKLEHYIEIRDSDVGKVMLPNLKELLKEYSDEIN